MDAWRAPPFFFSISLLQYATLFLFSPVSGIPFQNCLSPACASDPPPPFPFSPSSNHDHRCALPPPLPSSLPEPRGFERRWSRFACRSARLSLPLLPLFQREKKSDLFYPFPSPPLAENKSSCRIDFPRQRAGSFPSLFSPPPGASAGRIYLSFFPFSVVRERCSAPLTSRADTHVL